MNGRYHHFGHNKRDIYAHMLSYIMCLITMAILCTCASCTHAQLYSMGRNRITCGLALGRWAGAQCMWRLLLYTLEHITDTKSKLSKRCPRGSRPPGKATSPCAPLRGLWACANKLQEPGQVGLAVHPSVVWGP